MLGDGARWIWNIADAHFPHATQIVDYFHAREHLAPAKRPKDYHRLDVLPRTPTGKVRRLDLPDLTADGA